MTVKPYAGFIADFPDDQVEEGGDIVVCGGRNVAVALGEILTGLGREVSAPEYSGEKGWEFDFYDAERHRIWCQVTSFHPAFWLLIEDPSTRRSTRTRNAEVYTEIWGKLAAALEQDPRFHSIVWRSADDGPPEPEDIGDARARKMAGALPPEPLALPLRPIRRTRKAASHSIWLVLPLTVILISIYIWFLFIVIFLIWEAGSEIYAGRIASGAFFLLLGGGIVWAFGGQGVSFAISIRDLVFGVRALRGRNS